MSNAGNRADGPKRGRLKEALRQRLRRAVGKSLEAIEKALADGELTPKECLALLEVASRYGLGTQQEREVTTTHRYVVRMPTRQPLPVEPGRLREIAVIEAPALGPGRPAADRESDDDRGTEP